MSFITIYITHANKAAAQEFSDTLLKEKLIACANLFPMTSSYWWQGEIENASEWVSLLKTSETLWDVVLKRAKALHPYDTPCIMKTVVEANAEYEQWIEDSVVKG